MIRGGKKKAQRQKKREMTCLEQTNLGAKRKGATEKKPKSLTLWGTMSGKKRQHVNAITDFQEFRYEGRNGENATKEDFFLCITPEANFSRLLFLFLPLRRKRFPPGSILHPPAD